MRLGLAAVFIYAGCAKLVDPRAFARIISHWDLVPELLLPVVAIGLPSLEVLAGIALIFDMRIGLHAIAGMIIMFIVILGYGVFLGLDVDCGCFGTEELEERQGLYHALYRDMVFLAGVVFLYWSRFMRSRRFKAVVDQTK